MAKYLLSLVAACVAVTIIVAATGFSWFMHINRQKYGELVRPAMEPLGEILSKKNASKQQIRHIIKTSLVRPEIAMSAVFHGEEKTVYVRGPDKREHLTWPLHLTYPLMREGQSVGSLRIWPCAGCMYGEMTKTRKFYPAAAFFFTLWIIVMSGVILLFLRRIFGPLQKLGAFSSSLGKDSYRPLDFTAYSRDWQELARQINRLNDTFEDNSETLRMLFSVSKTLTSNVGINDVFVIVADIIQKKFPNALVALVALGEDGFLRLRNHRGFSPDFVRGVHLRPGEGFVGQAYQRSEPVIVNDTVKNSSPMTRDLVEKEGLGSYVHIPLITESKCGGILTIASQESGYFTPERVKTLTNLGEYLSIALQNASLYERVQELNRRLESEVSITTRELIQTNSRLIQKVRELKVLSDIAAFASTRTNVSEILEMIIDKIKELLSAQSAGFFFYIGETNEMVPYPPFFGIKDRDFSRLRFRVSETKVLESVLMEGKNYVVNDISQAIDVMPILSNIVTVHSLVLVPLRSGKKPIGVLGVANKFSASFTNDDIRILELVADRVAGIIENVRLYQELAQRIHDLTALQEISSAISSEPVWEQTLKKIIATATHAFSADLCALLFYDEKTRELVTQTGAHFTGGDEAVLLRIPVDDSHSLSAEVFRSGEPFLSPDASIDIRIKSQTARLWDVRSLILVPLKAENRVIGVLRIGRHQANAYTNEHLRLASLIAHQAATIIENAHLYDSLRETKTELEELNKIKNEFISTVSHELRTPITAIKGFIKVVLEGEAGGINLQQEKFLKIADQSIDRLTILVSDLLDISRIESGQMKLSLGPVDPREVIEIVLKNVSSQISAKKLSVLMQLPDNVPMIMADRARITQVFDNLIVNAIKFTPEGGTITVAARDKGDFVVFNVIDTGIGIDRKDHQKIFEKFYQVDSGSTRATHGTGLGLAIVKSIVEIHGGQIGVESDLGSGANFQFIIPRAKTEINDFRRGLQAEQEKMQEN